MLWSIHCLDREGGLPARLAAYDAHKAYLAGEHPVRIALSGPLLAADGDTMIGSLFLVVAADRAAVEAFSEADPFRRAGIWEHISIHPFRLRTADAEALVP